MGQRYFELFETQGISVIPMWLMPPAANAVEILGDIAGRMLAASANPIVSPPLQFHCGLTDIRFRRNRSGVIASIVFEGNRLPTRSPLSLQAADAILVPSSFCRHACLSSGISPHKVFDVSYPLNTKIWHPDVKAFLPKSNNFRFLWMNTWNERKGWDVAIRAFWSEFSADDGVELVIKSYIEDGRKSSLEDAVSRMAIEMGVDRNTSAPVRCIDSLIPAGDLPGFMKSFDAYVSPHRSEGFGLNVWHAMALGIPVIATGYGGTEDFVKEDTAWPVKIERMTCPSPAEIKRHPQLTGMTWAEPDFIDLGRKIRECFSFPKEASKRAVKGANFVALKYSEEKVAKDLAHAIETTLPGTWEKLQAGAALREAVAAAQEFESIDKPLVLMEL